ncbi:MAG: right-handed parallel beta-helix repeat-containing protein [Elusimicrobia bacterium]|nr:right-handed parallel beta-helix repeat-containing protein [Elusimicrobiota bacterium]
MDEIRQEVARTPNADAAGNPVYFTIESTGPLATQFVVKDEASLPFPMANEVIGSTVALHMTKWTLEKLVATAYDSNTRRVTLSTAPKDWVLVPEGRFFLMGKSSFIDQPGEWAWENGSLYLRPSDDQTPTGRSVTVSRSAGGLVVRGVQDIQIEGVSIQGADPQAVLIENSSGISLKKLQIKDSGRIGILSQLSNNVKIDDCDISNSGKNGILNYLTDDVTISNNRIKNSGTTVQHIGWGAIFTASSTRVNILNNAINNSGYHGISASGDDTLVQNNIIENVCWLWDDCGGIYTNANNGERPRTGTIRIIGNIVNGMKNTLSGGIYLDDLSHNVIVQDNTIQDVAGFGIYIHNSYNNSISGNTIFNSKNPSIWFREDNGNFPVGVTHDNTLTDNLYFPGPEAWSMVEHVRFFPHENFGTYDRNVFWHDFFHQRRKHQGLSKE